MVLIHGPRQCGKTMVQRDERDLARIASLDTLSRLLNFAAAQTARLINISDLGAPPQRVA